jgi:putative endonuclease
LEDGESVTHYCYLLVCSDNTLYCGYTNNLNKRIAAHNKGKGAKYTKTRLPVKLVYSEVFDNKSEAMKREWQIKQYTRKEKLKLINDYK